MFKLIKKIDLHIREKIIFKIKVDWVYGLEIIIIDWAKFSLWIINSKILLEKIKDQNEKTRKVAQAGQLNER